MGRGGKGMVKIPEIKGFIVFLILTLCMNLSAKDWMYSTPKEYLEAYKTALAKGLYDEGDKIMAEMLDRYPTNSDALFYKAGVLYHEGKHKEAKEYLEKCIKYNPHYAKAYRYLGAIAEKNGNFGEAEKYYKKCIKFKITSPAHLDLAELYAIQGRFSLAEEEINLYFKYINNPTQYSYVVAAYIHRALGKDEKVIEDCLKGLEVGDLFRNPERFNPDYTADLLLTLAKTYEKLGRLEDAKEVYEYALSFNFYRHLKSFKDGLERVKKKLQEKQRERK
jgi:tetratricopeptide (TPR) repeat protein